jgi:hypothetical protein
MWRAVQDKKGILHLFIKGEKSPTANKTIIL